MLRSSLVMGPPIFLMDRDKRKCHCIANFVLLQCVILYVISITILRCVWSPYLINFDPYKLASIMYLYDIEACGVASNITTAMTNLKLSQDTRGFNVLPLRWEPAIVTVSTRLSKRTRMYIEISIATHIIWMILTFIFKCVVKRNNSLRSLHYAFNVYYYYYILVIICDVSMAIVYVTHIKQALTNGMIVRYSGWRMDLKLANYEDFAGYLPMIASACWMRGIVITAMNVYSCIMIRGMLIKIRSRDIMMHVLPGHQPFPEVEQENQLKEGTLYYRPGERQPYVKGPGNFF